MARIGKVGVVALLVATVLAVVAISYYLRSPSSTAQQKSPLASRLGSEGDFAAAGANGLKPALEDLAKRINETRGEVKAQGVRIKTIEDRPAFDFKKYEKELRENIIKDLPPSVPMSQYRALEKKVGEIEGNFPLRSAA